MCALDGRCVTGTEYSVALAAAGNRTNALSAFAPMGSSSDYANYAADLMEAPLFLGGAVAFLSSVLVGISLLRRRVLPSVLEESLVTGQQTAE